MRARQAALVREAMLEAASAEFAAKGYDKASIRSIARAAGMATGTVFNYATSKLDLLHQVLHDDLETACQAALATPDEGETGEQLVAVASVFLDHFAGNAGLSRVLLKESLFATGQAGGAFRDQVEQIARDVARRIEIGRGRGEVGAVETSAAVLLFLGAYYFALIACLSAEPPNPGIARDQLRLQMPQILGRIPQR